MNADKCFTAWWNETNGLFVEDFPEDDFEQRLDDIVEDRASNPMEDDSYFDYAKLGDELGYDGYTFTTDGCICLL